MVFTGIAATVKIATSSTQSILFKRNVDQALRKHSSDDDEELEYLAVADVLYQKQKRGRLTGVPNPITSAGTKVMQKNGGDHRICVVVRAANQKTGTAKVVIVLLKPAKKGQVTQDGELPLDTCHTDASFRANRGAGMLSTEPGDALKVAKGMVKMPPTCWRTRTRGKCKDGTCASSFKSWTMQQKVGMMDQL